MENTGRVLFEDDKPQWFVATGDQWTGPLSASDVYEKVNSGQITWAHFVWKEGQSEWKRICDLKVFQGAIPNQPPKNLQSQIKQSLKPQKPDVKQAAKRSSAPPSPPKVSDDKTWFLYFNDSQFGPFSKSEIERFLKVKKITSRVHAWCDGMDNWERLEKIAEFKTAVAEAPEFTKSMRIEQRVAPRRPLVAKIMLANSEQVSLAVCRDISVGGMQVLTDKIPGPVGAHIKLNVSPAGGSSRMEPFVAEGMIVRVLEDGHGFSFRFDRLPENAKRAIESYIDSTV